MKEVPIMSKGNQPRFTVSGVTNGIVSVHINRKYRYFIDYIYEHYDELNGFIYRGQRNPNKELLSTLDRRFKDSGEDLAKIRVKQLKSFKKYSIGKRNANVSTLSNEREWWALGQHYGLDTPLLDWTESPFVAVYFAFKEKAFRISGRNTRIVFALNRSEIESYKSNDGDSSLDFYSPEGDENSRIISQSGLFTITQNGEDIESWVVSRFSGVSTKKVLIKFYIPNTERENCLKSLDTMNINHATLFPDLMGASVYTNMKLQDFK